MKSQEPLGEKALREPATNEDFKDTIAQYTGFHPKTDRMTIKVGLSY
jgi:hypothetical protein